MAVARSCTRCISAPRVGSMTSVAKRRPAQEPARPIDLVQGGLVGHERGQRGGVPRGDLAPLGGERVGPAVGVVEELVDGGLVVTPVEQVREVPEDVVGVECGHRRILRSVRRPG